MSAREEELSTRAPKVERDDVPGRRLWGVALVAAGVVVAAVAVAAQIQRVTAVGPTRQTEPPARPEGAELGIVEQALIRTTRRGLDEQEVQRQTLEGYRWVDRRRGVAAIPIERAMDLVTDSAFVRRALTLPGERESARPDGGA